VPQPVLEAIPDSGSATVQLTVTGVVFHPVTPGAGLTLGVITGGVVSPTGLCTTSWVGNPAALRSDVASTRVFPTASDRKTVATVHIPSSLPAGIVATAVAVTDVFAAKVADALTLEPPDGLRRDAWKVVAPERSSVTWKLIVTLAEVELTVIVVGLKLKEVREGAVESEVDVTVRVFGKPAAARPSLSSRVVFPAASVRNTELTVQAPGSLNLGNVTAVEPVTVVAGFRFAVPLCVATPEGLRKVTCSELTPERSSVAAKLTVTLADADVVLIEFGETLNCVRAGGAESVLDVTVRLVGKLSAASPLSSKIKLFPAASLR
jgi:hypothetical protein